MPEQTRAREDDPFAWAALLAKTFKRVAIFAVHGTEAEVVALHGVPAPAMGITMSLRERTPLRWTLEAGSPLIGAGKAPGGDAVANLLGVSVPRAFAIVPLVRGTRVVALAYGDAIDQALPLLPVSQTFELCHQVLNGEPEALPAPERRRELAPRRPKRAMRRGAQRREAPPRTDPTPHLDATPRIDPTPRIDATPRVDPTPRIDATPRVDPTPRIDPPPLAPPPLDAASRLTVPASRREEPRDLFDSPAKHDLPDVGALADFTALVSANLASLEDSAPAPAKSFMPPPRARRVTAPALPEHAPQIVVADLDDGVVTPDGVIDDGEAAPRPKHRSLWRWPLGVSLVSSMAAAALAFVLLGPTHPGADTELAVKIPAQASVAHIAGELESYGVVRSAEGFQWLARLTGADRSLRAGTYRLPRNAWAWDVLKELEHGQVETVQITIPEGLTLAEVAQVFATHGLADADAIVAAAKSPDVLQRFEISGPSAEGFLFPETYTFARGLKPRELVEAMIEQFFVRMSVLPEAVRADPAELMRRVTLASIVEREARDKDELTTIAGVFGNRLERNMKLESCATVQYLLPHPKDRLTLADVRKPSPYNTYLNLGLPPGPIANPGLGALKAAFRPAQHDYLFFFAKDDGSHRHVFTRTYAEHMKAQRELARAD